MKTIVVDTFDKAALRKRIADQNVVKGDTLCFILGNREESAMLTYALALLVIHLDEANNNHDFANSIIKDLFGDKTTEEMEREIEQEYGISIEVNDKPKIEPLYESFPGVEYNPGWDEAYLRDKIEKGSKAWEGVDVQAFLNEMRGRD